MRSSLALLPLGLLLGCGGYYDDTGLTAEACVEQRVLRQHPRDSRPDAWVGGLVVVELLCAAPDASLSLRDDAGEAVDGEVTLHHGARQVRFAPGARLRPETSYLAHLETSSGVRDWSFTTGVSAPVGSALEERAFALRPGRGLVLEPPGLGEILDPLLTETVHPVLQILEDPATPQAPAAIRLGARLTDEPAAGQDLTVSTRDGEATWSDPALVLPISSFETGAGFEFVDGRLAGEIAPGAAQWMGGVLRATWITDRIEELQGRSPGSVCGAVEAAHGAPCAPCVGGEYCLELVLIDIPGPAWGGGLLQTVD